MDEVITSYLLAMDELNVLTATSYYLADGEDLQAKIAQIVDDVLSLLIKAYRLGVEHAFIMIAYELTVSTDKMQAAIYQMIDGKDFTDRVADHVQAGGLAGLQALVESEFHRVYNTAVADGVQEFVDEGNFGVEKVWHTMGDEKVRDTHVYLDGKAVAVEDEFYTYDDDHAPYPGKFTKVENNANCRCILTYRRAV